MCLHAMTRKRNYFLIIFEALFALIWLVNFVRYRIEVEHIQHFFVVYDTRQYDTTQYDTFCTILYVYTDMTCTSKNDAKIVPCELAFNSIITLLTYYKLNNDQTWSNINVMPIKQNWSGIRRKCSFIYLELV